jgi:hypothetical protein
MQSQDFVQRNSAFLLSVFGILSGCVAGLTAYFLKSRCTKISCLCFHCERDPLPPDAVETTETTNEV